MNLDNPDGGHRAIVAHIVGTGIHQGKTLADARSDIYQEILAGQANDKLVGCDYTPDTSTQNGGTIDWSYSIVDACFEGVNCPQPVVAPAGTRHNTCEQSCKNGDPNCLVADLRSAPSNLQTSLGNFESDLLSVQNFPAYVDTSDLVKFVNQINGDMNCTRDPFNILDASGHFENGGGSCDFAVKTTGASPVVYQISFPGKWTGTFAKLGNAYVVVSPDDSHNPSFEIISTGETDPINEVDGDSQKMLFSGAKYYCALVKMSH